jgi:hypothetical protein
LLADLAALFADPAKLQREIKRFSDAAVAAERSRAKLAETQARHAETVAAERARLEAMDAALRAREVKVRLEENRIQADLAELEQWKRDQRTGRLVQVGPGIFREPDDAPNKPDPHYGDAA